MPTLIDKDEHYVLPIEGFTITSCIIDGQEFAVEIVGPMDEVFMLLIYSDFYLTIDEVDETRYTPKQPETLADVLGIIKKTVETCTIEKDGTLVLSISNRLELTIEPANEVEAWSFFDAEHDDGLQITCLANGKLYIQR